MNATVAALLVQDGLTNGLLYALIALSILIVFLVTRVFWIPAGEFVVFGALTMGMLNTGSVPGTVWLLPIVGLVAAFSYAYFCWRAGNWRNWQYMAACSLVYPPCVAYLAAWLAPLSLSPLADGLLTLLLVAPMAPLLYVSIFRPISGTSVLTKLIVAVALHTVLVGAGLLFFGPEGVRA